MGDEFWLPVQLSVKIAFAAGVSVWIAGTLAAKAMAKRRFPGKFIVETIILLPLVLSPSVIGFLLMTGLGRNSVGGKLWEWLFGEPVMFTWWAAVIAAAVVAFPLMYEAAKTGFEGVDKEIEEAAKVDGAGGWRTFLHITVPLSHRALLSGAILSFARALGEFGATLLFAGNIPGKTQTMPTAIYVAIESGNMKLAWLWVGCTVLISAAMLIAVRGVKGDIRNNKKTKPL